MNVGGAAGARAGDTGGVDGSVCVPTSACGRRLPHRLLVAHIASTCTSRLNHIGHEVESAADVLGGIVKPPGFRCVHWRCLWTQRGAPGGSAILGKSLPELIQGLHRPTRSLADWFLRVSLRAHVARVSSRIPARRRVAAWSDPAPTAFAWALDTSAGSPSVAASTRAQQSRGHLNPLDYLREVTQHRGVLV